MLQNSTKSFHKQKQLAIKIATIKIKEVHTEGDSNPCELANKENDPSLINLGANVDGLKLDSKLTKQSVLQSYGSEDFGKSGIILTEESLSSYDTPLEKFEVKEAEEVRITSNLFIPVKCSRFLISTTYPEQGSEDSTYETQSISSKEQSQLSNAFKKYLFEKLIKRQWP